MGRMSSPQPSPQPSLPPPSPQPERASVVGSTGQGGPKCRYRAFLRRRSQLDEELIKTLQCVGFITLLQLPFLLLFAILLYGNYSNLAELSQLCTDSPTHGITANGVPYRIGAVRDGYPFSLVIVVAFNLVAFAGSTWQCFNYGLMLLEDIMVKCNQDLVNRLPELALIIEQQEKTLQEEELVPQIAQV